MAPMPPDPVEELLRDVTADPDLGLGNAAMFRSLTGALGCSRRAPPLPLHPLRLPAFWPVVSCTRLVPFLLHPPVELCLCCQLRHIHPVHSAAAPRLVRAGSVLSGCTPFRCLLPEGKLGSREGARSPMGTSEEEACRRVALLGKRERDWLRFRSARLSSARQQPRPWSSPGARSRGAHLQSSFASSATFLATH